MRKKGDQHNRKRSSVSKPVKKKGCGCGKSKSVKGKK
ncbi:hypothetical protein BkAM31D_12870 [Halalkalibacter krulwichiae]|uniref:Uncharacterized protein n=1 Tax=Halalkalibacter krulwichiae TaxID=199441 RepID=A0A1X9MB63_9BACI|nr:hypothetical protein BkAM31D_12870 [Halalkalibacter krulwichiae]